MLLLKSSHVMGNLIKGYPIRTKKVLDMGIWLSFRRMHPLSSSSLLSSL